MVKENSKLKFNIKLGFSLAEVLVSMLIMSVMFLALTKIMTQKPKKQMERTPHGYYECYRTADGTLHEDRTKNNVFVAENTNIQRCEFEPPKGVYYINFHYINSNRPVYYNTQQVIFDETAIFNDPSDGTAAIPQSELTYEAANFNNDMNMFKTYLEISHPQSRIYTRWINSNSPPVNALFIAW